MRDHEWERRGHNGSVSMLRSHRASDLHQRSPLVPCATLNACYSIHAIVDQTFMKNPLDESPKIAEITL